LQWGGLGRLGWNFAASNNGTASNNLKGCHRHGC
jgi:hypothetical protein